MEEVFERRKRLFSGAAFSSAIFYNGDQTKGGSPSYRYFSGCDVDGSYLILKKGSGVLFTSEMNCRAAKRLCGYPVKLIGKDAAKAIGKMVGRGKCACFPDEMSARRYLALRKKAKLKLIDGSEKVGEVRGRKSADEVKKLAASAKVARGILDGLKPWKCGSEEELACVLKKMALDEGAEVSFEPIVATGGNSALAHHKPTAKKLGAHVLVDFGVKKNGYCSDFTRCYSKKSAVNERKAYEKCRKVFEGMKRGLGRCKTGKDVAALSSRLMNGQGLPRMPHAVGHGIGVEVHEYPHLNQKSKEKLDGAVLAIEPAAYFSKFGVRYEGMLANVKGKWREL